MDQVSISRATLARLRAERAAAKDPAVVAGLDDQIRLHADLAGPDLDAPEEELRPVKRGKNGGWVMDSTAKPEA